MKETGNDGFVFKRLGASNFNDTTNGQVHALFEKLNASIPQLEAREVATTNETILYVCQHQNEIIGMALMATYKVISGHKGMIEDVVVNEQYRGKGIGRKLIQGLLEEGHKLNLSEILLFSGHHRKAAISLYTSLGFILKESGLYQLSLN
ncbi:MAG: GNAT family N-acetyltransferase [Bacteroidota bacterium]